MVDKKAAGNAEDRPLLMAVSARALLDMRAETEFLESHSLEEYSARQRKLANKPLKPGVAFTFVERMLSLNAITKPGEGKLVEVVIASHMDPDTGMRVTNSVYELGLPIRMALFTSGSSLVRPLSRMGVRLYLSMSSGAVQEAVDAGLPAGQILTDKPITEHDDSHGEIRLGFDFDGVIGDDSSEDLFRRVGLEGFNDNERKKSNVPLSDGPLGPFMRSLAVIQKAEQAEATATNGTYKPRLRVGVITSRGIPADARVMSTLRSIGVRVDDAAFMDGHDKSMMIQALRPHLFFDDQVRHLDNAKHIAPAVHVPFGVANETASVVNAGDRADDAERQA